MLLRALHWIFVATYVAAPVLAMLVASFRGRRGNFRATSRFLFTVFIGTILGTGGTIIYALSLHGRAPLGQIALAIYFATSVLFVLRAFDATLKWLLQRRSHRLAAPLAGRSVQPNPENSDSAHASEPSQRPASAAAKPIIHPVFAGLIRIVLLLAIGVPYVLSSALVYRPRIVMRSTPHSQFGLAYTNIEFASTDGMRLSGWWIPASRPRRRTRLPDDFGTKTVLVCPGLSGTKASQLVMARRLVRAGYNALALDFRAQGQSDGQFCNFGDLERRDVLGAVRWVRQHHPDQSQRIVGVGASTGGAALIAAAVDPSDEGRAIKAIAVYDSFDDLSVLVHDGARAVCLPPMDWLAWRVGLPLASAQVGANLLDFKPARLVHKLWPRPIMVIHGMQDELIPFDRGQSLFDAASFPKQRLWLPSDTHNEAIEDPYAADVVLEFFETARPTPAI